MKVILMSLFVVLLLTGCTLSEEYDSSLFKDYSKWVNPDDNSTNESINESQNITLEYNFTDDIDESDYMIGSFNIQIFGEKKANSVVMPTIEDIIDDYDILAIQEVRDSTGTVVEKLNGIDGYDLEISPRLGRSTSKEQYIFFYSDRVVPSHSAVYPDENDDFEREPFAMEFKVKNTNMILIQVHIKPDDAEQEIRHLSDVVSWAKKEFGKSKNIYIMGDLNADCVYFDSFSVLEDYQVLIDEDYDTTVALSSCAYDRILATEVDPNIINIGVDDLQDETNDDMDLIRAVSDHYPIFMVYDY